MQVIKKLINISLIFVFLHGGSVLTADHKLVDPAKGIPLFLKIIAYDNNFNADAIESINIYFVYDKELINSYQQLTLAKEYFRSNKKIKVADIDVVFKPVPYGKLNSSMNNLSDSSYNILIVTELEENQLNLIKKKSADSNIRSFSFNPEHVELGYSVSIKLRDKKTKIVINLGSSKREGSEFSAHLLKICDIYKN